jgi:hypothetical protein
MAGVNALTIMGLGLDPMPVAVIESGFDVAVQLVTVQPPLFEFGVKAIETDDALTASGVPMVGASGTPRAMTVGEEAFELGLVPTSLVQFTVKVYAIPCVNPVTVIGLTPAPLVDPAPPAGLLVA